MSKGLVYSPSCGLVEPTEDVSSPRGSPFERFLSSPKQLLSADPGILQALYNHLAGVVEGLEKRSLKHELINSN